MEQRPEGQPSEDDTSDRGNGPDDGATSAQTTRPLVDGKDVRTAYRRWAPVYSVLASPTIPGRNAAARRVNRLEGRILEAGVGTGSALPLYGQHLSIVGVDLSHDMLVRARQRVAEERLDNLEGVLEMDLARLAFPDGAFDGAVCMFTITAVPNPRGVMGELARVVRPGGTLVIASHFRASAGIWWVTDRILTPFARRLGWNPAMDIAAVLDVPGLKLVEREPLPPAGLVTMLVFEKTA